MKTSLTLLSDEPLDWFSSTFNSKDSVLAFEDFLNPHYHLGFHRDTMVRGEGSHENWTLTYVDFTDEEQWVILE
jgi:hypothetical protein